MRFTRPSEEDDLSIYTLDDGTLRPVGKEGQRVEGEASLNGYFEQAGSLGKITLSGFSLCLSSLSSDLKQEIKFSLDEWEPLCNLLSTCQTDGAIKALIGNFPTSKRQKLSLSSINKLLAAQIGQKNVPLDCFTNTTTSKIIKKKDRDGNEVRYLVEIKLP